MNKEYFDRLLSAVWACDSLSRVDFVFLVKEIVKLESEMDGGR